MVYITIFERELIMNSYLVMSKQGKQTRYLASGHNIENGVLSLMHGQLDYLCIRDWVSARVTKDGEIGEVLEILNNLTHTGFAVFK